MDRPSFTFDVASENQGKYNELADIVNAASVLRAAARETAADLRRAEGDIERWRSPAPSQDDSWEAMRVEMLAAVRNEYKHLADGDRHWKQDAWRLRHLVAKWLPKVALRLKHLPDAGDWKNWDDARWKKFEAELLRIQNAGLVECNRLSTKGSGGKGSTKPPPKGNRPRITAAEANLRARAALQNQRKRWGVRSLAEAIGCSQGLVSKLDAWRAYQDEREAKQGPAAPKAMTMTDRTLASEGREDAALEQLIKEHQADFEDSPLVSHARKQRRRRPRA